MAVAAAVGPVLSERAAQAREARWRRVRALLLDLVVFTILFNAVNLVYGVTQVTGGSPPNGQPGSFFYTTITEVAWPWLSLLWMAYYIVPESLYGASLGKMLLGLCVVRVDGRPLGLGSILARNVLRFVDVLPGFYLLAAFSRSPRPTASGLVTGGPARQLFTELKPWILMRLGILHGVPTGFLELHLCSRCSSRSLSNTSAARRLSSRATSTPAVTSSSPI